MIEGSMAIHDLCSDYWAEKGREFSKEGWWAMAKEVRRLIKEGIKEGKGKNVIVSGPSRTGKTEIKEVLKDDPSFELICFDAEQVGGLKGFSWSNSLGYLEEELGVEEEEPSPEGILTAIKRKADEAKEKKKKILVLFFDEWQRVVGSQDPKRLEEFYLNLSQEIGGIDNAVGVHCFKEGEEGPIAFLKLYQDPNFTVIRSAERVLK